MAKLRELLRELDSLRIVGDLDVEVRSLHIDSRKVEKHALFVAQRGLTADGHQFIPQAIEKGATAVVLEDWPEVVAEGVSYIQVDDSRVATGLIASSFYGHPSRLLKVVGVTGTNGKTTVATLGQRLMMQLGYKAGLFSTVEVNINGQTTGATHTTPDAIDVHKGLAKMVEAGCEYAFMEVSSHALDQNRTAGLKFTGAVFTNISHDHLDYHGDFRSYLDAKKRLFDQLGKDVFALVNRDEKHASYLLQNCRARQYGYGLRSLTDFKGKILENSLEGLKMRVDEMEVDFKIAGTYNAYNLLAVYGAGVLLGHPGLEILEALTLVEGPEGRLERVWGSKREITGIVDYAHSPDALEKVLKTLAELELKGGRIITVCGCGGDRDRSKRPIMGGIAARLSGLLVLTSDNPRSEDPVQIVEEMYDGIPEDLREKVYRQVDRKEGIRLACQLAKPGDIVLVAGKGHEKFQEIKGVKHPFDDKEILGKMLP